MHDVRTPAAEAVTLAFALTLLVTLPWTAAGNALAPEYAKQKLCWLCHKTEQGQTAPVTPDWEQTKHAQAAGEGPRYHFNDEPAVGCQACHGPGQEHARAKPEEKKATIHRPADIETRDGRLSLCGRCHGRYEEGFIEDYTFGESILDRITLTQPTGGPLEQLNEMADSKHFTADNGPTCIDCHTGHKGLDEALPHQTAKPVMELCGGCHQEQMDLSHSKQENIPPDATCITCHMPESRHVFKVPAE